MGLSPISSKVQATNAALIDGKSSPNQHIYYFWSQTGNVVGNDAIMARLFIVTLKGVAFDSSEAFLQALSTPGLT